jgi:anion-transporting  ArsA/GET3 family ATPase
MPTLPEREFLFVSGKGGVGKTTVATALAIALSRSGREVLLALMEPDPAGDLLGGARPRPDRIERSRLGPWVTVAAPEAALAEYGGMMLRSRAAFEALFENRYGRTFLRAVPGLYQWAVLGKAWFHSEERTAAGTRRFDTVVFDAPATGHALEMLRVPKLLTEIAPVGLLRRDAESAWHKFTDRERSGVVLVTLGEELAVSETLEFIEELERLGLPIAEVFVNAQLDVLFSAAGRDALIPARERAEASNRDLYDIAIARSITERTQQEQLERLVASCAYPVKTLPWAEVVALGKDPEPIVEGLLAAARTQPTA